MSDIKDKIWQEINDRIAKRKEARARAINNNTIEAFVLGFIKNIEDINTYTTNEVEWQVGAMNALNNLKAQMMSFDKRVNIEISWYTEEGKPPVVNGVIIKWSRPYQIENNCDPELFLDVTMLLLN